MNGSILSVRCMGKVKNTKEKSKRKKSKSKKEKKNSKKSKKKKRHYQSGNDSERSNEDVLLCSSMAVRNLPTPKSHCIEHACSGTISHHNDEEHVIPHQENNSYKSERSAFSSRISRCHQRSSRYDDHCREVRVTAKRHPDNSCYSPDHRRTSRSSSRGSSANDIELSWTCWPSQPANFDPVRDWRPMQTFYDPLMAGSIDGTDRAPHDHAVERAILCQHRPNRGITGDPRCTLFVGRLPTAMSLREESELMHLAEMHWGRVNRVHVPRCPVTGEPRRYAFVELKSARDAARTIAAWRREVAAGSSPSATFFFNGSHLLVDWERGRLMPGWRPRRLVVASEATKRADS